MTTEIVAYSETKAAIASLSQKYKDVVYDTTKPDQMNLAVAAYKDINAHSIILEKARVKEKADSLAYGKRVDSEAREISDQLDSLRLPIKTMIETETKRAEREKAAKEQAEREATEAKAKADREAEERKMAAERAEIARQQEEIAQRQREANAKIEADQREARLKIEEEQRAARLEREEADRKARLEIEAQRTKEKEAYDAAQAIIKAEQDRKDAEERAARKAREELEAVEAARQAKIAADARAIQEAEEKRQREIQRQANELLDGEAMLRRFLQLYGERPEFVYVVVPIQKYLKVA